MKKKLPFWASFLALIPTIVLAQGGLLLDGVQMVADGSVSIVIENGKWKNTSSTFSPAGSTVKFAGTASTANSTIEGNTTFYHLEIAKSSNDVRLVSPATNVQGKLYFTSGKLDLSTNSIGLETNAILAGESGSSRTYSTSASGYCSTGLSLSNPANIEPANLGMRFTASGNFGSTYMDRRHNAITLPSGNNVLKHWRVLPTNSPGGQNATLRFYYFDAELNGLNENDLTIWRSTNNGVSWVNMGFTSRNTSANYVEQTGVSSISGWWTLGAPPPANGPGDDRSELLETNLVRTTWSIYPNPVVDVATVSVNSDITETAVLEVVSANGQIVMARQQDLVPGANNFPVNVQQLPSGTYFARILGSTRSPITIVKR